MMDFPFLYFISGTYTKPQLTEWFCHDCSSTPTAA